MSVWRPENAKITASAWGLAFTRRLCWNLFVLIEPQSLYSYRVTAYAIFAGSHCFTTILLFAARTPNTCLLGAYLALCQQVETSKSSHVDLALGIGKRDQGHGYSCGHMMSHIAWLKTATTTSYFLTQNVCVYEVNSRQAIIAALACLCAGCPKFPMTLLLFSIYSWLYCAQRDCSHNVRDLQCRSHTADYRWKTLPCFVSGHAHTHGTSNTCDCQAKINKGQT